jgi:hypothetical protein
MSSLQKTTEIFLKKYPKKYNETQVEKEKDERKSIIHFNNNLYYGLCWQYDQTKDERLLAKINEARLSFRGGEKHAVKLAMDNIIEDKFKIGAMPNAEDYQVNF